MNLIGENEGKRIHAEPESVRANDTIQLVRRFPTDVRLKGLLLEEKFTLERVLIGSQTCEGSSFAGQEAKAGAWVIALVRNEMDTPRTVRGTWYVEGDVQDEGGGAEGTLGVTMDPGAPSPQSALTSPAGTSLAGAQPAPAAIAVAPPVEVRIQAPPGAVVPGTNEFAVLLMHGDIIRLMGVLKGEGGPITDRERPHLMRRFEDAMKRSNA